MGLAQDVLGRGVEKWLAKDLSRADFRTGSSQFNGEWLYGSYMNLAPLRCKIQVLISDSGNVTGWGSASAGAGRIGPGSSARQDRLRFENMAAGFAKLAADAPRI